MPRFKMLSAQVFVSHRLKLGPDLRVPAHLKLDLFIPQAHSCLPSSARLWDLSANSYRLDLLDSKSNLPIGARLMNASRLKPLSPTKPLFSLIGNRL